MRIVILALVLVATGCTSTNPWKQVAPYPDYNGLNRFENKEVICYNYVKDSDYGTMVCKFK